MDIGMTLPVMEPDLWDSGPETLESWSRAIDAGPFASVCFGERMAFDNPETLTLLGAVAAWTSRVRIATTVVVPQLHDPVLLAKSLATADQLCRGRLSVGLGVGGREEDYRAAGADLSTRTMTQMADRVATMRRVWAGEKVIETVRPVGPPPCQVGGPELLVGTLGPKTIKHAASWSDGLAGVTLDLDVDAVSTLFDLTRAAWAAAGRTSPRLTTSFWVALDDGRAGGAERAREQIHRHLRHYMNWIPVELVDAMAPTTGFAGTPTQLRSMLDRFAGIGADEVQLIPTDSAVSQVHDIAAVL